MSAILWPATKAAILYGGAFAGVAIHEAGHYFSAKFLTRLNPTEINIGIFYNALRVRMSDPEIRLGLLPVGGQVAYSGDEGQPPPSNGRVWWSEATPRERIICILGGPLSQLAIFILPMLWLLVTVPRNEFSELQVLVYTCCLISIAIVAISLFPSKRSDGGQVLQEWAGLPPGKKHWLQSNLMAPVYASIVLGILLLLIYLIAEPFGVTFGLLKEF